MKGKEGQREKGTGGGREKVRAKGVDININEYCKGKRERRVQYR